MELDKCRSKYLYLRDDNDEPLMIVSNFGLKKYQKAYVSRKGEYHNFCVEAMEDIPSILTNHHITRAIETMKKNMKKASIILNIFIYYQLYGVQIIYYTIDKWLKINNFEQLYQDKIGKDFINKIKSDKVALDTYISTQRHHPINGKIKIVNIGTNTKTKESVVPSSWLDRVFKNAQCLHDEMNNLPTRKGKSPVTYCTIYSNSIKNEDVWIDQQKIKKNSKIYKILLNDVTNCIYTKKISVSEDTLYQNKLLELSDKEYIDVDTKIINNDNTYQKTETIGYLCSLLQKCVRRGPATIDVMTETMHKLNKSPPYNLPDLNFATVSGTRQLVWRLYISIIEDGTIYINEYEKNHNTIDMLSLTLLAIVSQLDPRFKLIDNAVDIIGHTLSYLVWQEGCYRLWRTEIKKEQITENECDNDYKMSIYLALKHMPMMKNDNIMLHKAFNIDSDKILNISCIKKRIKKRKKICISTTKKNKIIKHTKMAALDMHCHPIMLIILQGKLDYSLINVSIKSIPTLSQISHFIWNYHSKVKWNEKVDRNKYIFSKKEIKKYDLDEKQLQRLGDCLYKSILEYQNIYLYGRQINFPSWIFTSQRIVQKENSTHDKCVGRVAWLLIFGKTYRYKYKNRVYNIILAGHDKKSICRVKRNVKGGTEYVEGDIRENIQIKFLKDFKEEEIILPNPPDGYNWNRNLKKNKVMIGYDKKKKKFTIDSEYVVALDLSRNIKKIGKIKEAVIELPYEQDLVKLIQFATYVKDDKNDKSEKYNIIYRLKDAVYCRRELNDYRVFDWKKYANTSISSIWLIVLARIYTSDVDGKKGKFTVNTGPCNRQGKKTNNSISYKYEGVIYRILTLLEALYPFMMCQKSIMKWSLDKTRPEYYHMLRSLNILAENNKKYEYKKNKMKIATKLWDHQEKTINTISNEMIHKNRRGFGDASRVGAGKTLCALGLMCKLYKNNYEKNKNSTTKKIYHKCGGFLVLVPSIRLIKTWEDEIRKHSIGFDIVTQQSNGILRKNNENYKIYELKLKSNTIILTTMGRIRDHPIQHPWILVVIDECLSVQNKEALQTEEAWRQSCYSEYGVIMLSATFFRSRFDKMLYMIKMLKSGLPEQREYLDSILSETIISNVTKTNRIWTCETHAIEMNKKNKKRYDKIYRANTSKSNDMLYQALNKYIHNEVDYIKIFYDVLDELDENKKAVIFTNSKHEADEIVSHSNNNDRIKRYPEMGDHTVLSYAEGTYGLNDLVKYNTILMRPPEPDKLPQIKGRLDRPNQLHDKLYIHYIILKDTIEEASILRMNICNNFCDNYLMPLAEYYELAISHHKKHDKK